MHSEELRAIEDIRQLKARYFRVLDEQDWDALERIFTETAEIDTTDDGAPILSGGVAFRKFLEPILAGVKTVHHGHTSEIVLISADEASGIWAMEDRLWFPEASGGGYLHGFGWYRERYCRGPEGLWRIDAMRLQRIRVDNGREDSGS